MTKESYGGGFWRSRAKSFSTVPLEASVSGIIWGTELARATLVNPESGFPEADGTYSDPILTEKNTPNFLFESLQHSGDFGEGFLLALSAYYSMSLVSSKKIPEKVRMAAASLTSSAIVGLVEMSVIFDKKPDPLDIPAGVAGSLLWIGAHQLSKKLMKRTEDIRSTVSDITDQH